MADIRIYNPETGKLEEGRGMGKSVPFQHLRPHRQRLSQARMSRSAVRIFVPNSAEIGLVKTVNS